MADSTFGLTRPCCVYGGLKVFIWRHSRLKEASLRDAHLIITQAHASKRRSALQSALKKLSLRLLCLSLKPPLSPSPSSLFPLSYRLARSLFFSNTQTCYVSCYSTHLPSRVNENKIPELFFFFFSVFRFLFSVFSSLAPSLHLFCRWKTALVSVCRGLNVLFDFGSRKKLFRGSGRAAVIRSETASEEINMCPTIIVCSDHRARVGRSYSV